VFNAVLLLLAVTSTNADSVLKRGKTVPATPTATIGAILADPAKYPESQVVVIDGTVVRSCTAMGCWMQLADSADGKGLRVDFHDAGFFIPLGAAGMKARAMGTVTVTVLKPDEAAEAQGTGSAVVKNEKGEPVEVGLQATGVELYYVD
jgi:hypothetical protein